MGQPRAIAAKGFLLSPGTTGFQERPLKKSRGFAQPDVILRTYEDGRRTVVKTWGNRPGWERSLLGRRLAAREARALGRLKGLPEVPVLIGRPDKFGIEMSYMDSIPFPNSEDSTSVPPSYFDHLWRVVAKMHELGMNHGDIRRKNLLRDAADPGRPVVLDLTQSFTFSSPQGLIARIMMPWLAHVDRIKFLQLKADHAPSGMTPAEQAELEDRPLHMAIGRFLRKKIYRPFKHWRQRAAGTRKPKRSR